ncbi:prephenate dehydrogenase [Candidatus Halobonum tyrrellensis]|uniref:Prephenate dehydrogenase n=1 Tax=Candidatus Halobonum tyrrellensis G22 TaxID=1324957 RepID=V4HL77_9EURY|nr:prephenate dehydrogenase [Candidatus Halobonum tyrrellensis]ESP88679.1 prephenate dehydrogenase [Candidatus Halobonum tyrrellensis G22]
MRLLVVGAGQMGRWAGEVLRSTAERVGFVDTNPQAATDAAEAVVDGRVVDPETDERFDCVVLAVPIPDTAAAVERYAPNAADGALVDVSGAMTGPLEAMEEHADGEYASFHPLFAPERAPGNVAYVPGRAGATVDRVRKGLIEAGNDVFETTADEHDDAMASVQTAAHTAVLAYALAADEGVDERFQTPVSEELRDLARTVTAGNPRVYADIRGTFGGADDLATAARALAVTDDDRFVELFERAGERVAADDWAPEISLGAGLDEDDDGDDADDSEGSDRDGGLFGR